MANARKIAQDTMIEYFASKGETWPAIEAEAILRRIEIDPDHRWTDRGLATEARRILERATFSVDDLVENHLKVGVAFQSLEYLDQSEGCRVYGCAYPQRREMVICERTLKYEPLLRTTAIHELGHVLMHGKSANRCMLYKPQRPASSPEEREANAFMQAVILPDSILDLAIHYICDAYGIDLRFAYEAAGSTRGRWVWKERLFAHLINMLCISREMIAIKMKTWGYFSEETDDYHKTYALQTRWHSPAPRESLARPLRKVMARLRQGLVMDDVQVPGPALPHPDDQPMARSQVVIRVPQ